MSFLQNINNDDLQKIRNSIKICEKRGIYIMGWYIRSFIDNIIKYWMLVFLSEIIISLNTYLKPKIIALVFC